MTSIGCIEACVAPLDRARRAGFRWAAAFPALRAILYHRDRRIAVRATVGVAIALALTLASPVAMMAVSPAIFGIPHLASDVRYLVVRQRLPRWWVHALLGACVALFALRLGDELCGWSAARLELAIAALWVAGAAIAGASVSGAWRRLALVLPVVAVLGALALAHPDGARLVFAHLHNVIALILWAFLFRRRLVVALAPLAIGVIGAAILLAGATPVSDHAFGLSLAQISEWFAPGLGAFAVGVTLSFIFLQAIHYAVWLGWIPQEELPGESTQSFRASIRGVARDLGTGGLWLVIALVALMLAGSVLNLHATRDLYLSLAVFHGYLELAMLCYLVVSRPGSQRSRSRT